MDAILFNILSQALYDILKAGSARLAPQHATPQSSTDLSSVISDAVDEVSSRWESVLIRRVTATDLKRFFTTERVATHFEQLLVPNVEKEVSLSLLGEELERMFPLQVTGIGERVVEDLVKTFHRRIQATTVGWITVFLERVLKEQQATRRVIERIALSSASSVDDVQHSRERFGDCVLSYLRSVAECPDYTRWRTNRFAKLQVLPTSVLPSGAAPIRLFSRLSTRQDTVILWAGTDAEFLRTRRAAQTLGEIWKRPLNLLDVVWGGGRGALDAASGANIIGRPRIVMLGEPGAGKTTAIEKLALDYATEGIQGFPNPALVPLHINLHQYAGDSNLYPLINAALAHHGCQVPDDELPRIFEAWRFAFLLDGLNEVSSSLRDGVVAIIKKLVHTLPTHVFVITCRESDYYDEMHPSPYGFVAVTLQELAPEQVIQYLQRCFGPSLGAALYHEAGARMQSLLQNPLNLLMFSEAVEPGRSLPNNRARLYTTFVLHRLAIEQSKGERGRHIDFRTKLAVLHHVAFTLLLQSKLVDTWDNFLPLVAEGLRLAHAQDVSARRAIDELVYNGLLRVAGRDDLTFMHPTIQEFFCAEEVVARHNRGSQPSEYVAPDKYQEWSEVARFTGGLADDPLALCSEWLKVHPKLGVSFVRGLEDIVGAVGQQAWVLVGRALVAYYEEHPEENPMFSRLNYEKSVPTWSDD